MTIKSLGNPFDGDQTLIHSKQCGCPECNVSGTDASFIENKAPARSHSAPEDSVVSSGDSEDMLDRAIESAVVRSVFGHNDHNRRSFMKMMGAGTAAALLSSVFPLDKAKAAVKESMGKLEKTKLNVGFVPITCATPIIMAHPLGFYEKYGLDVEVTKTAGWAVARDKSLAREYDASHMLTPMPLAMTMGAGSTPEPFIMPAVENINGQAIVLHVDHKNKRDPKDWKGFKFGVPFEYSMHNFLLRYYLAENGVDPDKDVQIRVVPPPEMVANLRAGNLDGYLSPDPFNQRAVWEKVGFIHMLTKEIWEGHPCCAFACSQRFASENPNTYGALLRSILDATQYSNNHDNRQEIAEAIAPRNYLNQPVPVIQQVLTGRYADGLGEVKNVPDRIDFDPFPWHSMGVWILTQMKRWGYIEGDVDYKGIAEQVYLAGETGKVMKEMGMPVPDTTYKKHVIMGKTFDPDAAEEYTQLRDREGLIMASLNVRAFLLSISFLILALGMWEMSTQPPGAQEAMSEYELLMGGADQESRVPPPSAVIQRAWQELSDPFYDAGSNDKGIGTQLAYSVYRVLTGYLAAMAIALPLGFLIGMSPLMYKALNPYIQVLRPISPLAWMPLALFIIQDSDASAIFVIFICSIWPMLLNTAFGVANVRQDWINVARTHELGHFRTALTVILPAAAPTILTGMRISIGIAWLVIVAAEMLVGGTGIGYYVWNEWNNLDLASVIFSILMIGVVGMLLDLALGKAQKLVEYTE